MQDRVAEDRADIVCRTRECKQEERHRQPMNKPECGYRTAPHENRDDNGKSLSTDAHQWTREDARQQRSNSWCSIQKTNNECDLAYVSSVPQHRNRRKQCARHTEDHRDDVNIKTHLQVALAFEKAKSLDHLRPSAARLRILDAFERK